MTPPNLPDTGYETLWSRIKRSAANPEQARLDAASLLYRAHRLTRDGNEPPPLAALRDDEYAAWLRRAERVLSL